MKKDIKMSDGFALPLRTDHYDYFLRDVNDNALSFDCNGFETEIAHAINNHDRLVAENEKQSEQIDVLKGEVTGAQIQNDLCTEENDSLVAENKKQAGHIKMLRDALIDAREHQWGGLVYNGRDKTHPKWVSGCNALKETEGEK